MTMAVDDFLYSCASELKGFYNGSIGRAKPLGGVLSPTHIVFFLIEDDCIKLDDKRMYLFKLKKIITGKYGTEVKEKTEILPETYALFDKAVEISKHRNFSEAYIANLVDAVGLDAELKKYAAGHMETQRALEDKGKKEEEERLRKKKEQMAQVQAEVEKERATHKPQMPAYADGAKVIGLGAMNVPDWMDLFTPPPSEIGEIVFAFSSARRSDKPPSQVARTTLAVVGVLVGLGIGYMIVRFVPVTTTIWKVVSYVVPAVAGSFVVRLIGEYSAVCTYVGRKGLARFHCFGNREKITSRELFLFREATELRVSEKDHYDDNGSYQGTYYNFVWTDDFGKTKCHIGGNYNKERTDTHGPGTIHQFAYASEKAWSDFLFDRFVGDAGSVESLKFKLSGKDWVRIGRGFIDFDYRGSNGRWTVEDMIELNTTGTMFTVMHKDAKKGFLKSTGIIEFPTEGVANSKLFVMAVNRLLLPRFLESQRGS